MTRTQSSLAVVAIMAAILAGSASAADSGWYVGAGGGWSQARGGAAAIDPNIAAEGAVTSLHDKDAAWQLYGGYQFNPNFALEGGYVNLGKFSVSHTVTGGTEYDEVKPECWHLSAVGILPLGKNFSLLGKAGVCAWNDHPGQRVPAGFVEPAPVPAPVPLGSSGTDLTYGLGAQYDFSPNWGMRAGWDRFPNVIHHHNAVDLFSASVNYKF